MQIHAGSGSAAAALSIIGTGLALALPEEKWIGWALIGLGLFVFLFDIRIENWRPHIGRGNNKLNTWGPWLLIVGGPLLGLLWLYFQSHHLKTPLAASKVAIATPQGAIPAPITPQTTAPQLASPTVARNKNDVRRLQDSLEEIYEFLSAKDLALQNDLSNLEKFRMFVVTNKGKAHALDTVVLNEKNIAQLYSKVIGDFPKQFRTDWSELKPLLDGAQEAIAPLSNTITGYRSALARISEPPSLEDADSLLNAVKPVQQAIPAFREWLAVALHRCEAMKIELRKAALIAD